MSIEIRDEDSSSLDAYAAVPIAYIVREVVDPSAWENTRTAPPRRPVDPPYVKDYDAIPGNHPAIWADRFSIDRACFLGAYRDGHRVAGIVIVVDAADVLRLGGEEGSALIWDLRVAPPVRGQGIGRALLASAEARARAAGKARLMVETQNVNVASCALYASAGYSLVDLNPGAYADFPDEIRLLWEKTL